MNPYEILDVPPTASEAQIKSAYRRKARETHPDVEGGDGEKFSLASRAYSILMDPEKRKTFDDTGSIDEVAPLTVRQRMIQIVAELFNEALKVEGQRGASLRHFPLMKAMRAQMQANLNAVRNNYATHKKAIEDRKFLLLRISRQGDGENLFATIITDQIKMLEPVLRQSDIDVRAMDMAVDELMHYENEVDLVQAIQVMQYGGNFTTQNQTGSAVFHFDQAFMDALTGRR